MSGLPYAAPTADTYDSRPTARARAVTYAWAAAPLLLGACGLILSALATAYGSAFGSHLGSLCLDAMVPPGFAPESYRDPQPTLWPLGTACVFGVDTPQSVTVPEEDWTATHIALVGTALAGVGTTTAIAAIRLRTHR